MTAPDSPGLPSGTIFGTPTPPLGTVFGTGDVLPIRPQRCQHTLLSDHNLRVGYGHTNVGRMLRLTSLARRGRGLGRRG
jgi:hypothetical protein